MTFKFLPSQTVRVPEIPFQDRLELPAAETALIVVDMQNDFVKSDGALVCPAASDTVPRIQQLIASARQNGGERGTGVRVVYTQDSQIPADPEFDIWPEHCVIESWGWHIVEELAPREGDLICRKNRYDGFYGTWLDHFLSKVWDIEHIVIVGTVSNICVAHTAASAGLRWYNVVVPADGISAMTEFDQALTLRQVSSLYNGHILRSTEDIHFIA